MNKNKEQLADECFTCGEKMPLNECPDSKRECGHHCNHSWSQDECCWCGKVFDDVDGGMYEEEQDPDFN